VTEAWYLIERLVQNAAFQAGDVFFCCADCQEAYEREPDRYHVPA
jgi:hypothetical protein